MRMFPDDVSVAIITHNSSKQLPKTIRALEAAGCAQERIGVVDVASTDETRELVRSEWPRVRLSCLAENQGPNPARNLALTMAPTPYLLLLDSDVRVEPQAVQCLRRALQENQDAGIATPLVVYEEDPDKIQYAGAWTHFICEAVIRWQDRSLAERGTDVQPIGCASGNALLIAVEAAKRVGWFDEDFFMGKEDGEFTHRIRLAGYDIVEVPGARVRHRAATRSNWLFVYQIRNRWYFILKNYQIRTIVALIPVLLVHEVVQFVLLTTKGQALAYFKALAAMSKLLLKIRGARAQVAGFRKVSDRDLLQDAPFVVRGDIADKALLLKGKAAYDRFLRSYWRCVRWGLR